MGVFRSDLCAGRVALVTGGGTGIGRGIARALGLHGAKVCIASRRAEVLEAAVRDFEADGIDAMWVPCDVRDGAQVEAVIDAILERWERLDIVVNNAAGNFPAPISGLSYNGFKAVVDIDLRGTYNVTKAAFDKALATSGGHVVNISAPFDHMGVAYQAHCAAAKMGVDSLTRTCAVEFGPHGVRVNGIAPGAIGGTEGMARLGSGDERDARCPLGYVGTPDDIANAVLFLCSEAAAYVTGQVLCVDGGSAVDMSQLAR
ncbi:MAG: SDR family oxidoreductase [Spirochaetaceae bacterium]|nr:SDR family oxidoreductase [Myxococcales bacterium]MCB9726292.1 SDR family oxidoreductase [Spirochaetaceae bacterium]HPG25428.1 SDR family oxidoreductase [Myxococcota bacterium]